MKLTNQLFLLTVSFQLIVVVKQTIKNIDVVRLYEYDYMIMQNVFQ